MDLEDSTNKRILGLALEALYHERQRLDDEIAGIQRQLGRTGKLTGKGPAQDRKVRRLSSAGRKAIAASTKKRWAAYRAAKAKKIQSR